MEDLTRQILDLQGRLGALETYLTRPAWITFTPTLSQGGAVAATVTYARYVRVGKLAVVQFRLSATAAGTGGNSIAVASLPTVIAPAWTGAPSGVCGSGLILDSGTALYPCAVVATNATTLIFYGYNETDAFGVDPAVTLASGDSVVGACAYEVA